MLGMNTDLYSRIFKQHNFWHYFRKHEGVLVFQVDTVMLLNAEHSIHKFVKYDISLSDCRSAKILTELRVSTKKERTEGTKVVRDRLKSARVPRV